MGIFRKKKSRAPLSTSMYQGDNATPVRSPPRNRKSNAVLTPDTEEVPAVEESSPVPVSTAGKSKKEHGFFRKKKKETYIKVTPDKKGGNDYAGDWQQSQQQQQVATLTIITPTKSPQTEAAVAGTPPGQATPQGQDTENILMNNTVVTDDDMPALESPGKYQDLPPTPDEKDIKPIKRNLKSAFDNSLDYGHDGMGETNPVTNTLAISNTGEAFSSNEKNAAENKKFLPRFRASWKKSLGKVQEQQNKEVIQRMIQQQEMQTRLEQQEPVQPVPQEINHSDEGSVPSLITEPEGWRKEGSTVRTVASTLESTTVTKDDAPASPELCAPSSPEHMAPSFADGSPASKTASTKSHDFFSTADTFSTQSKPCERKTQPQSQQLRQQLTLGQKFMSLLQCGGDTTTDSGGYFGRIKCLDLCQTVEDRDELQLMREEDARFVIHFMNEMIKNGIKLIYHQPPSPTDPSSDWTQVTIRMFLLSGNCHESVEHPKLAWAILPVASRKILTGSYDNDDESSGGEVWTYLSLWDVYSIMGAEDDATSLGDDLPNSPARSKYTLGASTIQSEFDSRCDTHTREDTASYTHTKGDTFDDEDRTIPSSGFFSITAGSTGNVYVFEATSGSRRDHIVKGLTKLILRASNQLIAGKLDVCAELYGEDAAPMSGELPSLVTPTQALSRVTHSFLDEL